MGKETFKIMIVDDSKFTRMVLENILKNAGYSVKCYESALKAKEDIDNYKPHLILSDFMMPEMNGYEFCEFVKKKQKRDDIKFILVTSIAEVENKVKCFEVGADDYITKPFNAQEVIARVATHLRIKSLTDELQEALNKINKDLEIVRKIQLSLVPESFPSFENIKFSQYYNIKNKTGGDYLDFVNIDDNNIGVIVVDVEGHGIYSTVFMAIIKTIVTTKFPEILDPSEALCILNNKILSLTKETKFATIFYGIINIKEMKITYANAGHHEPVIFNKNNGDIDLLKCKKGFPVGLFPTDVENYGKGVKDLKKGDRIAIFTDGILEAKNPKNELFGKDRLFNLIKETKDLKIDDAKDLIINKVIEFSEDNIDDDVTLLLIEVE